MVDKKEKAKPSPIDDDRLLGWCFLGLMIGLLLFASFKCLAMGELLLVWLALVGCIIEVDIGIVQMHIRWNHGPEEASSDEK